MVLSPGFTRTEFQVRAGFDSSEVPSFLWQEAATVVQHALARLRQGPGRVRAGRAQRRDRRVHRRDARTRSTRRIAGVVVSRSEK